MRRPFARAIHSYKPPAKDGAKAKAGAIQFLCTARSIDGVTVERLAADHRLKPETARAMLAEEQKRRARLL